MITNAILWNEPLWVTMEEVAVIFKGICIL
jgi:hypothetical protein